MKVNSSVVDQVDYINWLLTITFKNKSVYQYEQVQPDTYKKLIWASSIWSFVKKDLKTFKFKKIK